VKPMTNVVSLGISRGWNEFKIQYLSLQGVIGAVFGPAICLVVLWIFNARQLEIEGIPYVLLLLPSFLGVQVIQEGLVGVSNKLALDREDGTLLRAKAIPQGMLAYLIARMMVTVLSAFLNLTLLLVPGLLIVPGLANIDGTGFVTLVWVLALGLVATAPIGAVIGAMVKSPTTAVGLSVLPMAIMAFISGIFLPITALPGWLQFIGQLFPLYWLGLGLRSAFLPEMAAAIELGGSWRPLETVLVLAAWAGVGLLLAPGILRRMARRTSGSEMEAGRRRYTQGGY
jgi:ABC-2 type transport system permease protein